MLEEVKNGLGDRLKTGLNVNPNKDKKIKKISTTMFCRLAMVTIFVNVLLILVVGSVTRSTINEKEVDYFSEILNSISSTVSSDLEGYMGIAQVVAMNGDIITLLENTSSSTPMQNQANRDAVIEYTSAVQKNFPDVINVGICSITQDAYLLHDGSVSGSNWSFASRPYYGKLYN